MHFVGRTSEIAQVDARCERVAVIGLGGINAPYRMPDREIDQAMTTRAVPGITVYSTTNNTSHRTQNQKSPYSMNNAPYRMPGREIDQAMTAKAAPGITVYSTT
jgi:hypothetical protein